MFIAVVTILSAVLLVMIGLTRTTAQDSKMRFHKILREIFGGKRSEKVKTKPTIIKEPSLTPRKKPVLKFKKRR